MGVMRCDNLDNFSRKFPVFENKRATHFKSLFVIMLLQFFGDIVLAHPSLPAYDWLHRRHAT